VKKRQEKNTKPTKRGQLRRANSNKFSQA